MSTGNTAAFYWDQAHIMFADTTVGRAEGIVFRIIGSWKPYLVPGMSNPECIYDYGSWVTGRIKKAYLDNSLLSLFLDQFGSAGKYYQLVSTLDSKITSGNYSSDNQIAVPNLQIVDVKFDWQYSMELQDYARNDIEFTGKKLTNQPIVGK